VAKPTRESPRFARRGRKGPVSREELLKHTVRGDPRETEQFVRVIYDLRRQGNQPGAG
jgi:hypothetical protein